MLAGLRQRAAQVLAGLTASLRNADLRRIQLAWALCTTADLAQEVGLAVYAFSAGGVAGVGLMGLVRALPAATIGPLASGLADRHRRERVLLGLLASRAVLLGAVAGVLVVGGPSAAVFVLAAVDATAYAAYRPAQMALLPDLARTPEELTASNVVVTATENLGGLVGPGLSGVLLAVSGPGAVFAGSALLTGAAAAGATGVRPETRPRTATKPTRDAMFGGFQTLLQNSGPRAVLLLYLAHTLCFGALNVLIVVSVLELFDLGQGAVGVLMAAFGAGGLGGSVVALSLVGRSQLAGPFRLALVVWGAALALDSLVPHVLVLGGTLAVTGAANAVVEVCAVNLLQRIVRERVLGPVLGVLEGVWGMFGLGSVAAAALVHAVGIRAGLATTGGFLVAVALITARALAAAEAKTQAPERELAALRGVPMFIGQPPLALERLALTLDPVSLSAGEWVMHKGDPGNGFYMIDEGTVSVSADAGPVELGPGDWFGEVALLADVPRTASVQTVTPVRLFALERDDFLAAVTAQVHQPWVRAVLGERLRQGTAPTAGR